MTILDKLIDIIYPPRCHVCHGFIDRAETGPFCKDCYAGFAKLSSPICTVCSTPFASEAQGDHLCEDCLRDRPAYRSAFAAFHYRGTVVKAIHQFKYRAKTYLSESLGRLMAEYAEGISIGSGNLLIMPVPLHPKRLRERGYNQGLLLARRVASHLKAELDFLTLRRARYTAPQAGLKKDERKRNVRGAFKVKDPSVVEDKTILLVDDVSTTGNTLNECARVLMRSGSREVFCLILAKAGDRSVFI
ncbi:ComF family protein [uncultured Desulfobacterium sp.]|uniref:ComF family protein n=1 Tax=uncultured Desulfobacterium sp. TaxID=201089 RepID=A0A445N0G0_9BACT|nr:ComF family protein [uncultured Desulfobacterium sp.]